MEKNMENEMETRECMGIIWGFIGVIIGIPIFRPLKGKGFINHGSTLLAGHNFSAVCV